MKGLTLDQYIEIQKYVEEHHRFAHYDLDKSEEENAKNFNIKYVDTIYDSRDQTIWNISFRGLSGKVRFAANHFAGRSIPKTWKYTTIYDLTMDYLKGEFEPKEEFYY